MGRWVEVGEKFARFIALSEVASLKAVQTHLWP